MKRVNYKTWSILIFAIFLLLFFIMAIFKSETATWIWQLALPILLVIQVIVILKAREQSRKNFEDEFYDEK